MNKTNISVTTQNDRRPTPMNPTERVALGDPDAMPLIESDFSRMRRTPQVKIVRRALDLTQEEFAERYHIPLGTLRDWEQGRAVPDQPARAYLRLIAHDPEYVNRALNAPEVNRPHSQAKS